MRENLIWIKGGLGCYFGVGFVIFWSFELIFGIRVARKRKIYSGTEGGRAKKSR
jgi:hypothetical protein